MQVNNKNNTNWIGENNTRVATEIERAYQKQKSHY